MKKLFCLLAFIYSSLQVNAQSQNLVQNGNFENYTTCPTVLGQVANCTGWLPYTSGSSDYFNCTLVPVYPFFGYQQPASGNGYMGAFVTTNPTQTTNTYKEYIVGTLTPLIPGASYEVSMSVNLADLSSFGTDDIGMFFFKNGPVTYNSMNSIPPVTPQLTFGSYGPIGDNIGWVRLASSFYADSAYDKIVIGTWKEAANSNHITTNPNGSGYAYYYYDSVVVRINSKITTSYADSLLCLGTSMTVPYNVHFPSYFYIDNVFSLQLSDPAGSFANPTILATQPGTTSGSFTVSMPSVTPGTAYRIRVVSSNPVDMSNESFRPITIGNTLPAKPVITVPNTCVGQTLNLSAFGTSGTTYKWTGPGGFGSTLQNPAINNVTAAANGTYIVAAKLYGCFSHDTGTVTLIVTPAAITAFSNSPVCHNSPLNLSATNSTAGTTYSWTGPNAYTSNNKTSSISSIPLAGSGNYIITASLNGCFVKDTLSVTVLATPMNVNATANTPICEGQTLNLNVTNTTAGVSYTWAGPNSFTANTQSPSLSNTTLTAAGDYITTLSINGCSVKDTVNVIINPIPTTPTASSNAPVCNGKTLNLYSGGSLAGAAYNWVGPNSYTSSIQNPIISNVNSGMAGIYTVSASLNGCTSTPVTTNVAVLYQPSSIALYVLPNDTICAGGSIQLIGIASNGGVNPQYKWLKNGSLINSATGISYTTTNVANKDKFNVILTPDNTCPHPDTSQPMEITVLPFVKPEVSIIASPGILISPWQYITFIATPINGGKNPTYQWKRNGQDIIGAVNDTWGAYTLSNNDTISVVLYSDEFCPSPATATSNEITITVKLGVDELTDKRNGFILYPNPNNGNFTLKGNTGTNEPVTGEVWNSIGQLVYSNALQPQNNILNTEIILNKNLPSGAYILKLKTEDTAKLLRFTVSK